MAATIIGAFDVGSNSCRSRFVVKYGTMLYAFLYNLNGSTTDYEVQGPGPIPITVPGGIGDEKLRVFKSADNGVTWFLVTDSEYLIPSVGSFGIAYCVGVDRSTAYLVYAYNVTFSGNKPIYNGVSVIPFDLVNEVWGTETHHTSVPLNAISRGTADTVLQSREVSLHLITRAAGDMILYFSGPRAGDTSAWYGRAYYAPFDGTTFGDEVEIPGQTSPTLVYWPVAACADTAGLVHFLIMDNYQLNSPIRYFNIKHIGMATNGDFGTPFTVTEQGYLLDVMGSLSDIVTYPTVGGERIAFAGLINDDNAFVTQSIRVFTAAAELDPVDWTDEILMQGTDSDLMSLEQFWWMGVFISIAYNIHGVLGCSADSTIVQQATQYYGFDPIPNGELAVVVAWNETLENTHRVGHYRWFHGLPTSWSVAADLFTTPERIDPIETGAGFRASTVFTFGELLFELAAPEPGLTESPTDSISLSDAVTKQLAEGDTEELNDSLSLGDSVSRTINVIQGPEPPETAEDEGPGVGNPNSSGGHPGSGPTNQPQYCIFEFYQMETPEDVEILPVPKKYDQLGPMRFDKIAKLFGFRVRLIQNGTTTSMPYQILGDDSISSPHYNAILFEGSFDVRPGIDNVYEIQLPKNVNSDIFRLVLGPVNDSFHRYDVLMKIQSSGMQGQSKWMPIR